MDPKQFSSDNGTLQNTLQLDTTGTPPNSNKLQRTYSSRSAVSVLHHAPQSPSFPLARTISEGARSICSRRSRSSRRTFQFSGAGVGPEITRRTTARSDATQSGHDQDYDEKGQKTADLGDGGEEGGGGGGGSGDASSSSTGSGLQTNGEEERTMGLVSAILMVMTWYD